jgi:ankyrin repeat protein
MSEESKPTLFRPGVGKRGMTELHWSAYCGDLKGTLSALEGGCNVNAVDTYRGYTALHWLADMAATGGERLEILEVLVAQGAEINIRCVTGKTALRLAQEAGSVLGDDLSAAIVRLGGLP